MTLSTKLVGNTREQLWALDAMDVSRYVVAMTGGAPAQRATLVNGMMGQLRANPSWSFIPLEAIHERYVGKSAPADRSFASVLGMLFDIGGGKHLHKSPDGRVREIKPTGVRQHFMNREAFVAALEKSPAKIHASLMALSLVVPETAVIVVDVDKSPARGVRRGPGDPLSDLMTMLVHNPTDVRFVLVGKEAHKLLPPSAPTGHIQELRLT